MSQFSAPSDSPDVPSSEGSAPVKRSRKGLIVAGSVAAVLLVGMGGSAAAASHYYADRALPGTTIAGRDFSDQDSSQITAALSKLTADKTYVFEVGSDRVTLSRAEVGVNYQVDQTVEAAIAPSRSLLSIAGSLFSSHDYPLSYTIDDATLNDVAKSLARKAGPVVQQASITQVGEGEFAATPAVVGKAVNVEKLKADVEKASDGLDDTVTVTAEVSDVEPTITTADAEAVIADAKALAARTISVSDGIDTFTADLKTKSSWVIVPESTDGTRLEAPAFDKAKVKQWVDQTAKDSNVAPQPTYNNVNAEGKVLVEGAKPGRKGYTVNNADKVLDGIMSAAQAGQPYEGEFDYDEIAPPVENRQVLPGAENMAYPAAEGEKWLEINLGTNSVSAYIGMDRVRGPIPIVPGSPGHETVTGLFHIYLKYDKQDMGCTPDWPYCAKDVPWVSYFHGSYAFHGAPWQDTFGWSGEGGSHGCINMPVPEAHWVHQWADMGTPVASHY